MASVPHSWFSCIKSSPPPPPPPPFTIYFCAKRLKSQRNNLPIQSFCESKCRSFTCLCVFQCAFTVVRIFVASGLWCTSLVWVAYGVSLRGVQPLLMKTDDRGPDHLPVSTAVHTWVSFVCCVKHSRCSSSISFISFLYNLSFIVISETWRCKKIKFCRFFSLELTGTRDSITLNENLQLELHPTPSQPNAQAQGQMPKGACEGEGGGGKLPNFCV